MITKEEQQNGSKVQSIDRAVAILETLSNFKSLSLNELTEKVGLHKATTYRLVNSLIDNGLVEKIEDTKHYCISLRMFELGNKRVQNIDFINVAKSNIRQLSSDIQQTVHLVIEDRDEVLYIDKYGEDHESKMRSKIGSKAPLYCTAVGKAILANRPNDEIQTYWQEVDPEKKTQNTITDFETFTNAMPQIRDYGFAVDDEEFEYGVFCVGSVFGSFKEPVAGAISISLPISEKANKKYYIQKALECGERITQMLGGSWNYLRVGD